MTNTKRISVAEVRNGESLTREDFLAIEEPLEIRLSYADESMQSRVVSITMRTPGNDQELAAGFLFTEGIIRTPKQILRTEQSEENKITFTVSADVRIGSDTLERNFYTTSSCGICGKTSIDAIQTQQTITPLDISRPVSAEVINALPDKLRSRQNVFRQTGGLHASAFFDLNGTLLQVREDVGRHNALDKLIGYYFLNGLLPPADQILLLSGRASFELIQKAAMAGITVVAAVGAPSSLAVETANAKNVSLLGFLRDNRFNIYCGEERLLVLLNNPR